MNVTPTSETPPPTGATADAQAETPETLPNGLVITDRTNEEGLKILQDPETGHEFVRVKDDEGHAFLFDAHTDEWVLTGSKGEPLYGDNGKPLTLDLALNYETTTSLEDLMRLARILMAPPETKEAVENEETQKELEEKEMQQGIEKLKEQDAEKLRQVMDELKVITALLYEQQAKANETLNKANGQG